MFFLMFAKQRDEKSADVACPRDLYPTCGLRGRTHGLLDGRWLAFKHLAIRFYICKGLFIRYNN